MEKPFLKPCLALGGYDGSPGVPANGACISLFSETKHEWIKTIVADAEGKFRFESVKPGRYRLIARAPSQCPANIPIVVIKPSKRNKSSSVQLLIHFIVKGLPEGCSYGKLMSK